MNKFLKNYEKLESEEQSTRHANPSCYKNILVEDKLHYQQGEGPLLHYPQKLIVLVKHL